MHWSSESRLTDEEIPQFLRILVRTRHLPEDLVTFEVDAN